MAVGQGTERHPGRRAAGAAAGTGGGGTRQPVGASAALQMESRLFRESIVASRGAENWRQQSWVGHCELGSTGPAVDNLETVEDQCLMSCSALARLGPLPTPCAMCRTTLERQRGWSPSNRTLQASFRRSVQLVGRQLATRAARPKYSRGLAALLEPRLRGWTAI